jgi:diketogulonate reductase-like aldo/keto reductase
MSKPTRPYIKHQSSLTTVQKAANPPPARPKPSALPACRPQPVPKVLQRKAAAPRPPLNQTKPQPAAPLAYRPQPVPKVLQRKTATTQQHPQTRPAPTAPPAYRPQPVPHVLQTKTAGGQQSQADTTARRPVAPPVYRPTVKKILQPKMATAAQGRKPPNAPPVYRPQRTPLIQGKANEERGANQTRANALPPAPRIVPQVRPAQAAQQKPRPVAAPPTSRPPGSQVIQRRVTLKFLNKTIKDAKPDEIKKWLKDTDRTSGTSYEAEIKSHEIYEGALERMVLGGENLTYGFLDASTFMGHLRESKKQLDAVLIPRANHLVFGLDGKTEKQIWDAIVSGYRRFDCAESYGNTTNILASILANTAKIDRKQIEIYYKFDVNHGESTSALKQRLLKPICQFEYLDALIIHNFDEEMLVAMRKAWKVMNDLKSENKVKKIGLGNIDGNQYQILNKFGQIDVVENSLASVLSGDFTKHFIDGTGAELLVYHVIDAAKEIGINDEAGIKTMLKQLEELNVSPILSSSSSKTQLWNILLYGEKPEGYKIEDTGQSNKLEGWLSGPQLCDTNDVFTLAGPVKDALYVIQKNLVSLRKELNNPTPEEMRNWFLGKFSNVQLNDYNQAKVPRRKGLHKRYVKKSMGEILTKLLGKNTCDYDVATQLLQLMMGDAGDWDAYLRAESPSITK